MRASFAARSAHSPVVGAGGEGDAAAAEAAAVGAQQAARLQALLVASYAQREGALERAAAEAEGRAIALARELDQLHAAHERLRSQAALGLAPLPLRAGEQEEAGAERERRLASGAHGGAEAEAGDHSAAARLPSPLVAALRARGGAHGGAEEQGVRLLVQAAERRVAAAEAEAEAMRAAVAETQAACRAAAQQMQPQGSSGRWGAAAQDDGAHWPAPRGLLHQPSPLPQQERRRAAAAAGAGGGDDQVRARAEHLRLRAQLCSAAASAPRVLRSASPRASASKPPVPPVP